MPKRESALIALFHVRLRPLYCKQLRASLSGLSEWALEYFPPSPAPARHKGTSVADNTEVATVFFFLPWFSGCLKNFFFHASFFSFQPPVFPILETFFSAVPLCGPYWEDRDRHSNQPKVCLAVWPALSRDKSTLLLPHTAPHLFEKKIQNRLPHSLQLPLSELSSMRKC